MEFMFEIIAVGLLLIMSGVALITFVDTKHLRSDLDEVDGDTAREVARVSRETMQLRSTVDELFSVVQRLADADTELKNHIEQLQYRANHNRDVWSEQFKSYSDEHTKLSNRISSLEFKFQGHAATPDHTSDFGKTIGTQQ